VCHVRIAGIDDQSLDPPDASDFATLKEAHSRRVVPSGPSRTCQASAANCRNPARDRTSRSSALEL
jgi:hypothetical protein